jgi:hypothetical protein
MQPRGTEHDRPTDTPNHHYSARRALRIETAERLTAMMVRSLCLLDDCGKHTAMGKTDAVGALNAAARLIKANADITHALVRAAQGETRHRSVVETRSGTLPGLNPDFSDTPSSPNEGTLEELKRRIDLIAAYREAAANGKPLPLENPDDDADA